jgi:hypothetical protein
VWRALGAAAGALKKYFSAVAKLLLAIGYDASPAAGQQTCAFFP